MPCLTWPNQKADLQVASIKDTPKSKKKKKKKENLLLKVLLQITELLTWYNVKISGMQAVAEDVGRVSKH